MPEVTCSECGLPSIKGLPPMLGVRRFVDGKFKKILRHAECPEDVQAIKEFIEADRKEVVERLRKFRLWDDKQVVSYHTDKEGNQIRKVIAAPDVVHTHQA